MKRKMLKKQYLITLIVIVMFLFAGCSGGGQAVDSTAVATASEYTQVDQDPTKEVAQSGTIAENNDTENKETEMEVADPLPQLVIKAGEKTFYADLEDNSSAEALTEKLSHGEVTIDLHDYGNFEKVGDLPWELPRNDESITTEPGDIILYQGNQITIYYDENTWDFTRLAKISDTTREKLLEALGEGDVSVTFSIEWSE